jgi:hypothetical protein
LLIFLLLVRAFAPPSSSSPHTEVIHPREHAQTQPHTPLHLITDHPPRYPLHTPDSGWLLVSAQSLVPSCWCAGRTAPPPTPPLSSSASAITSNRPPTTQGGAHAANGGRGRHPGSGPAPHRLGGGRAPDGQQARRGVLVGGVRGAGRQEEEARGHEPRGVQPHRCVHACMCAWLACLLACLHPVLG